MRLGGDETDTLSSGLPSLIPRIDPIEMEEFREKTNRRLPRLFCYCSDIQKIIVTNKKIIVTNKKIIVTNKK